MQLFDAFWSSRIRLSGRSITRSKVRYLFGRILATIIKIFFKDLPWDTQSGFKIFRNETRFNSSLENRFSCRWLFEIELLLRIKRSGGQSYNIWEEPVTTWRDISGSKVSLRGYFVILRDLIFLVLHFRNRRVQNE